MTLPNFFVIGAGRSGTTSLQHYLSQHPEIFMPPEKAPSYFFCRDLDRIEDPYLRWVTRNYFVPDPDDYEALFDGVTHEKVIGGTSPVYLADMRVAGRIARTLPRAKLIALIRHPVDRVQARFVARTRDGLERRSLAEIIREELKIPLERQSAFGTYVASAACYRYLKTYFDNFPREQIRVHLFEDFADRPQNVLRDLFEFLDVDADFVPDTSTRHNKSGGVISHPLLRGVWTRTGLLRALIRPLVPARFRDAVFSRISRELAPVNMSHENRATLQSLFHHDIERLQELLERDLSMWLRSDRP